MPNPAELSPTAVEIPDPELREGTVLDDAVEADQQVRCVLPSLGTRLATDPLGWDPVTTAAGEFWPKKGDWALVAEPSDGLPTIARWERSATSPDIAISGGGGSNSDAFFFGG